MTRFRCEVVTEDGRVNLLHIEAPTQNAAIAQLIAEGATPIRILSGVPIWIEALNRPVSVGSGFGIADQALLLTQLAALIGAGLPVDRSLDLLVEQARNGRHKRALRMVVRHIRAGEGLAHTLERCSIFPKWTTGVIRSAEYGGNLSDALTSLAQRLSALTRTRRELVSALTYPAAVLFATLGALLLVLLVVVPQFKPVFAGQEDRLPLITRIVLALSDHAGTAAGGTVLVLVGSILMLHVVRRSERFSSQLAPRLLKVLPGAQLREQFLAAQFVSLLATLLGNGLTLVRALPLAADGLSSRRWRRRIANVEEHVREGMSFSKAIAREQFVPMTVVRLLEVGERTGKLPETAYEAGRIIEEAARARLQRLVALANPVAILTLGAIVAMLVAGVMLGIFALGDFAT